ncbi:MAG: TonB C-terminal domain-containing protein, partial [Desulfocapsaceae bacterium]
INVEKNGTITKEYFQQRSNDPTFDQFVQKAIQQANPLPPIPPALRESSYEFVLRFTPGNIQGM